MAGGVQGQAGGIAGLRVVLAEHSGAVEYDLLRIGKHLDDLGTPALSWRDLLVLVTHAQPDSATFKALNPEWQHTPDLELLRSVEYRLRWLQWVKTEDARRHPKSPPQPMPLPWDPEPEQTAYKGDALPIEELNDFLGWTPEQITQWRGGA